MLHEFSYIEPSSHFWNETNMVYNELAVGFCLCLLGLLVYDFPLSGVGNSGLSGWGRTCSPSCPLERVSGDRYELSLSGW